MSEFKINDYMLRQEAKEIAAQAMREEKEYGTDAHEMLNQLCDDHQWVIHTYKAIILCAECDTGEGEDYLDDLGYEQFDSFANHATQLAYATLLGACHEAYADLQTH